MQANHVIRIIDALPEGTLEAEVGLTARNLRHAKSVGRFSGLWYRPIRVICEKHGVFCPEEAFFWKKAAKKNGTKTDNQDGVEIHTVNSPATRRTA